MIILDLDINLTKVLQVLCIVVFKTLLIYIKENVTDAHVFPVHNGNIYLVRISILSKLIYGLETYPIKHTGVFHETWQADFKVYM